MKEEGSAMDKADDQMMGTETMNTEGADMMQKNGDDMMKKDEGAMMAKAGTYEAYSPEKLALAEKGKVVLFFRASWCPTCRSLDADIKAHLSAIPEGVTILDVDYDKSTALKQKYGVTMQHTLVQVDAQGTMITKWTGSPTLAGIVSNIK
jgi:thiol-disulfide isomerase/thioredoxin